MKPIGDLERMRLKSGLLLAFLAFTVMTTALPMARLASAEQATADDGGAEKQIAAISGAAARLGRQVPLPTILSDHDVGLYRAAFEAQDNGDWDAADRAIDGLQDPLLIGHLQAQRFLAESSPSAVEDLSGWLRSNADLPEAGEVYALAKRRQGGRVVGLRAPMAAETTGVSTASTNEDAVWEDFSVEGVRQMSAGDRHRLGALKAKFRALARQGKFDAAITSLDGVEFRRAFDKIDYDEMKTALAMAYYGAGQDAEALRWAEEAAERSGNVLPEAHWVAGLAMWRSGKAGESARHFEAVGNASGVSPWMVSAGAYWAARANLAAHRPEVVNHWLRQAAAYPRSFYGLLARRALGQDVQYTWESRPFTDMDADTLSRVPAARRALALIQVGDRVRAEDELRRLTRSAGPALSQALLSVSYAGDMPGLAVTLGDVVAAKEGRHRDSADYPLPDWRPSSGWMIDKSLVLAIARQESSFNPRAKSSCGAVGLMQLMPATARTLGAKGKLTDPQVNLDLGQRYVRRLLDDDSIKGNLLFLAASYNVGPGAVGRWTQSIHHNGDALLFLESIPVRETRAFVERVLTNFWAYRNRLGQDSPSLDAIAAGDWPMYDGGESKNVAVKHVKN